MATGTSQGQLFGTIQSVSGSARVIGVDGSVRKAVAGAKIFNNEMILTNANASVKLQLGNGQTVDIVGGSEYQVGVDAAPGAGGAEESGGGSPVVTEQGAPAAGVTAGFGTEPIGGRVIGTVADTSGQATATSPDGSVRVLGVGDKVFANETVTSSSGGPVNISLAGGGSLECGPGATLTLNPNLLSVGKATGGIADIQAAILAGADPTQVADPTAAGAPAAGGTDEGAGGSHKIIVIDQANSSIDVTAGFATFGAGIGFPTIEFQLLAAGVVKPIASLLPLGPTVIEGTDGGSSHVIHFTIQLDKTVPVNVGVNFLITPPGADGNGADISSPLAGTAVILAGSNSVVVDIAIVQDHFVEFNEPVSITLTDAINATIDPTADTATITIIDDDVNPVAVDDTNWVQEDGAVTATGNVLENHNHPGAPSGAFADVQDVDTDPLQVTNVNPITGTYGSLVLNADGSYTYTLYTAAQNATSHAIVQALDSNDAAIIDTFTYTVTDGFNTPDTATLNISVFGSNDGPGIVVNNGSGQQDVYEAGLPLGSDVGPTTTEVTGSFTLSDPDGLDDLDVIKVDGSTFSIAQLSAATDTVAGRLLVSDTSAGALFVTGYDGSTGVVTYRYVLDTATTQADSTSQNVFQISVSDDGTNFTAPVAVTVTIHDDAPAASPDTNSVAEDTLLVASGNVLANDTSNADTPKSLLAWGNEAAQYGTLTKNADGSYVYTLNNGLNAVQGLSAGETLTETFTYTMKDADGDTSSSTLTITITGTDDGVPIVGIGAEGGDEVVFENDLADGSSPNAAALTQTGSFTIEAKDGIAVVQVGDDITGATLTVAQLLNSATYPVSIDTAAGVLVITGYSGNEFGGTVSYAYTLQDDVTHATGVGANNAFDNFAVSVTDEDGSEANQVLSVRIVDDLPQAVNDGPFNVTEDALTTTVTGNAISNDHSYADDPASFVSWTSTTSTVLSQYGTLTLAPNGDYTFVLNNGDADTQALNTGETRTESFQYTMQDADGDPSTATLTITITGTDDGVTISGIGSLELGDEVVLENDLPDGTSPDAPALTQTGSFTIDAKDGIVEVKVGALTLTINQLLNLSSANQTVDTAAGLLTLTGYSGDAQGGTVSYSYLLQDNVAHATGAGANNAFDNFTVSVTDEDGSTSSDTLVVRIIDDLPIAVNDGQLASVDDNATAVNVGTVAGLFSNDNFGADGQGAPNITIATGSLGGTVTIDGSGNLFYTSATNITSPFIPQTESFTYTIKDGDGDTTTATFTVQITDEGPTINQEGAAASIFVDEEGLANGNLDGAGDLGGAAIAQTGTLAGIDFGIDGPGDIVLATSGNIGFNTLAGNAIETVWDGSTHILTGQDSVTHAAVFTLEITDVATGAYEFNLLAPVQHTVPGTEDDKSFTVTATVTDAEGEAVNGTISVLIDDDTPTAQAEPAQDLFEGASISGALDFSAGADGGRVTSVDGTSVPTSGTVSVDGDFGTLVIDAQGSYTYTADASVLGTPTETFSFTVTDGDGDPVTIETGLTFNIKDANTPIVNNTAVTLDEDGLPSGLAGGAGDVPGELAINSGTLAGFNYGGDGKGTTGGVQLSGGPLGIFTLDGTQVVGTWDSANSKLVGMAGGTLVLDITLNQTNGNYTATLYQPLKHLIAGTEDDVSFSVTATITDADGSSDTATFTVTVDDDAPVISGTTSASVDEEGLTGGNAGDSYATGDLAGQAITATGSLGVSFGADGPATSGSGYTLSATGATWDATTRTLSENGGAWTVTVATNGTYTFNLLQPMTHTVANTEDDLTINVGFTATDKDGDTKTGAFTVTVDDDAPVISGTTSASVDEEGLTGGNAGDSYATGDLAGQAITATGSLGVSFGADGPATSGSGYTLSATGATWDATTRTLSENGGAWTVTVATNGTYTFNLLQPMTHTVANTEDDLTINVGFTATDKDGDTKTGAFTVTVDDDAPVISGTTSASVDEEGLTGGNAGDSYATGDLAGQAITATGSLGVSFGADGPATSGSGYTLSATGATWDATTRTLSENGGAWTVTVATNGTYTFNLLQPMTHTVANTEDDLTINVGFTATDKDGDTKTGAFTVTVDDDAPVISGTTSASVDEEGLTGGNAGDSYATGDLAGQAITATGSLGVSFGADGPATSGSGYTLSATGATWDATTRTLSENGGAWTVTVATNGTYTFNLLQPMTHTVANTEDDLTINVGFTATDKDGDTKTGAFTVTVDDDAPVISGTTSASVDEEGLTGGNAGDSYATGDLAGQAITATGSLGVSFGADGPATSGSGYTLSATGATWDATTRTLSENGGAWTVTVATNGTYTFNLLQPMTHTVANTEDDLTINVGFTATDKDGDTKTGAFTVTVDDDAPVISGTTSASVDEEGLTGGNAGDSYATGDLAGQAITATGSLGVSFGADGPATSGSGYTLSATGATWDATTRTLSENGGAWTVTVATNGTYTFNLLQPMTHTVANTEDDLTINVGFTATDKDGDTKTGAFTVTVDDDAPVISGTTSASVDEEGLTGGNAGDSYATGDLAGQAITATGSLGVSFGADGPATSGSGYTLSATGATWDATTRTLSENGGAWTVTVATNGTYTFNLLQPMTHTVANTEDDLTINVGFTATDKDGDTKTGAFTVTVDDDAPVISGTTSASVDEEGLTGGNAGDSYATGDLAGQAITATGSLGVSFGADGPATSGSGYTLSATGATWDATTRTLSENGGAWTVTVATNGTYTFNLLQPMTHTVANTEDDLTINVGFTATDKDGDTKTGAFTVTVDDDAPVISGTTSASVDEEGLTGGNAGDSYATGDLAGQAITATGSLGVSFGADGPATSGSGYTLSATGATWDATTRTLSENGGAWTVTVATNGTYTFNLLQPMTHTVANTEDDLTINVGFTATDKDGDTKTGAFTVTVDDDAPVISGTTSASVDEEGLTGGNAGDSYATGDLAGQAITATGSLGVSFGADGPATSGSGYTLSATGATWDATTRTLSENGGAWTVTVATNGTYTFNLLQPMTHTVANTEDDLTINVGFTATDKDGDTKTGAFTVTVDDDAPVISGTTSASVDEEGLTGGNAGDSYATGDLAGQAITATGSLGVSFGADGPATSGSGYTLSATGATWDATTRTLSENGGAWTVTVATNGTYTFNLLQPMTHTVANTEDDLTINVGFTATDKDGDTKTGAFTVTVDDDAPVISGTTSASVDEEGLTGGNAGDSYATGDLAGQAITATGSLGVSFGADGPATSGSGYTLSATGATWDATTRTLSENGGAWTVTVATNGTYTFNLLQPMTHTVANTEDDLTINVGFTATDKDGDTKTGAFTVTVDDDAPVISGTTSASVDEEGLTGGNAGDSYATGDLAGQAITATGSLGVSFGADGPATSGSGYTLSATGATWDATTRTLSENGGAWTVTVATNGTYTFNLLQPMTHTVANTEDDLTINVGFTATDKDGDTKTGAFTVTVDDDAPVISGTTSASVDEEGLTGGNAGDSYATGDLAGQAITATGSLGVSFGADGPATSGSGYTLSATGATWDATTRTLSENGGAWTVTVATNGTYTFNLLQPMTHTVANTEDDLTINVGFTATDKDGDTKTGAFTVTVDDDAPVISGTTSASVDEEGLTGGNAGDSYATGDLAGQAITATGSLGVSFGADGPATSGSGYTLSATGATWDATTRTLSENGGAWTVTVATNGTYTFNLLQPMTHTVANTEDDLTINVGFTATDKDGDTKTGAFTVTVDDDAPVISGTTSASVDEEGLTGGNAGDSYATGDLAGQAITATGSLGVSFGADGPATSGSGYTLSATGATWDATTRTLSENGGAWTVTVATNGTYTFNLLQPMTHTVANTEDDLTINVGFTATDKDGDTKTGAFTVTVDDDAPVISGTTSASVDEEGLTGGNAGDSYATGDLAGQAITATGSLGVSFGADGPATSGSGYTLSATGATWDATTRTLSENGGAWTVTVATNGTYTFNLLQPMTHTVANTEDDLTINVGFTATDKDGDTKTGAFTVTVDDDAPVISGTTSASVDEEGLTGGNAGDSYATGDLAGQAITATGSLGVSFGADGPATSGSGYTLSATGATWDATTRTLSENGGAWTVTVATNGTYTFNLLQPMTHTVANTEDDLTINVGFTATDKDGDTKTGAFTVTVDDDAPVISGTTSASVDEEGLTGGNAGDSYATGDLAGQAITATGSLGVSFGADGPATSGSGYTLSATGATWDATTRTLSENGGAWTVTVATNGTYTFNLLQPMTHTVANTEDDLTINVGFTATDKDGDTKTGAFTVTVDDDAPVISGTTSASVDEEGLTGGNAGDSYATGDLAGQAITATGSLGVSFGADGPATSGSGYTLSATGATWDATTRTLSENGGAWTVTVATNGTYTFNLLQPMTHTVANTEDDLTINVGFTATDKDGDTKTGAFTVTVDDDAPVMLARTDLIYPNSANDGPGGTVNGGTGIFKYSIGADKPTYADGTHSDFGSITLSGNVGSNAITVTQQPLWQSENASTATFSFAFDYFKDPAHTLPASDTGTIVFNKAAGTYTVELGAPIDSYAVSTTSSAQGFSGYNFDSTPAASNPPVSVAQLTSSFFVQFSGMEEGTITTTKAAAGTYNAGLPAGGDLFTADASYVTISNLSNGVHGDTMQRGEILDMDFFLANPLGDINAPSTAYANAIFLKFDNIGSGEDLVVVLKLFDGVTHTTKAIVVDNGDIFKFGDTLPTGYNITLDSNDGAVIIESNDYNSGLEHYQIEGAQVLVSTRNITGTGIDLNSTSANGGASTGTQTLETGETGNGEPVKVSDIGFVSTSNVTQTANLLFNVTLKDADGDTAPTQQLDVTVVNGLTFTGGADHEAIQGSAGNDTLTGAGGNDILTGGAGVDTFDFNSPTQGVDTIKDFNAGAGEVLDLKDIFTGSETRADLVTAGKLVFTAVDADGVGGANDVQVAVNLGGSGALTSTVTLVNVLNATIGDLNNDTNTKVS